jgi:hypothetical protein
LGAQRRLGEPNRHGQQRGEDNHGKKTRTLKVGETREGRIAAQYKDTALKGT